ncbi:hypothetical protein O181_115374 [Austropuccinia psidii MF-1]|uniref:Myb-like domain-containing protein n=1 Tax=Austropuccinia psidii MF-1 TaxID=1389203 RepID=A0A9Q3PVJ5_9BASI|nr:hypothetical protein [Austropuccinia psidii MF-1]
MDLSQSSLNQVPTNPPHPSSLNQLEFDQFDQQTFAHHHHHHHHHGHHHHDHLNHKSQLDQLDNKLSSNSLLDQASSTSSNSPKLSHVRRPNWTTSEDEQLCRSWLENTIDPVTNTLQKGTQFWNRVAQDFGHRGIGQIQRNKDHVRNRWQLLQAKVIKFTSCYARIQCINSTNKTHDEIVADAMRLYEREESHKFTFYSSWLILRNSPHWLQWSANVTHKRLTPGIQPLSDIAVSPHSTISLLDSDESPTLDQQPINRLIPHVQRPPPTPTSTSATSSSTPISLTRSVTRPTEDENVDKLIAIAMKRKADVQEAALEVQLLSIDPDKITDPLRREVYTMKMEEIRDRYRAKRSKSREATSQLVDDAIQPDLAVAYESPQH